MQLRFNAPNFSSDDWRYESWMSFIDALSSIVDYWSTMSFRDNEIYMMVELTCY